MEDGLVGYWPLRGDCLDQSGCGNHGVNRGVDLDASAFNGCDGHIEISSSRSLDLGTGDFTLAAWVYTAPGVEGVIGDLLSQYDPVRRRGFTLGIAASAGGYNGQGDDRHLHFGIDDGTEPAWEACGRPSPHSSYVSNSLTVFDGHLYAATTDAEREEDWCHVYRYQGGQEWEACGRVGDRRTRGVGPMVVHDGALHAATWSYDWTRVHRDTLDFCRVYRYRGAQEWEECGQPGQCLRLFSLASFRGSLYLVGDDNRCYVYEGGQTWRVCREFAHMIHPMAVHDGQLYVGEFNAAVWACDGQRWESLGNPLGSVERCNQIHALEVYQGKLHATTWPLGHVARYDEGQWVDCGRLGDSIEMNGLAVYNGKLYAGTIPRAEVYRYDGGQEWTRLARFFAPEGWEPIPVEHDGTPESRRRTAEWTRVTSLTAFDGRLFASIGSCTSSIQDAPCDVRGQVFAMRAGTCVSYDRNLGEGWRHLAAVKRGDRLELYVEGRRQVVSSSFDRNAYDLSNGRPLKIGAGETGCFRGKIREARGYRRALSDEEVGALCQDGVE